MESHMLAPIVLFVYNRPTHTLQTLEALANNSLAKDSILYIYVDGAKTNANVETIKRIEETKDIIKQKQWCKEVHIIESEENKGLANSIVEGVTDIVNKYGKIIVLEDDIVTSPGFLKYMNDALDLYENKDRVMHISGFVPVTSGADKLPETYFLRFMSCWGWATWKKDWSELILDTDFLYKTIPHQKDYSAFNLEGATNMFSQIEANHNGTLKTWAIKWYSTIFLKKGLCLYPRYSVVDNVGIDGSGENSGNAQDLFKVSLAQSVDVKPIKIEENLYAKKYLKRFYIYGRDSSFRKRLIRSIKKTFLFKVYKKLRYQ
ncbi:glycosyltransferase family 2 protein [Dysgonomonas sp. ZJ279]|uniref:glycosyltransferase family 2 protein n=1 Tax=Dysgonomonas sp. ZJ279 TaxID=2709796 RepID=UPI0013EB1C7B|nr:glycosyltransferase [Dysgonomonas sp. ZJ279]